MIQKQITEYVSHPGTVRIKGDTRPIKAAESARYCLKAGIEVIEFSCMGANANQQAMKSMGLFMMMVESEMPGKSLAFQPLRYTSMTTSPETGENKLKDVTIWRTLLIDAVM